MEYPHFQQHTRSQRNNITFNRFSKNLLISFQVSKHGIKGYESFLSASELKIS